MCAFQRPKPANKHKLINLHRMTHTHSLSLSLKKKNSREREKDGDKGEMPSRCTVDECNRMASYRDTATGGGVCEGHADLGSSLVRIHAPCQHTGCIRRGRYSCGTGTGLHCRDHKSQDMWDTTKKRCRYEAEVCESQAVYNLPGLPALMCPKHKESNMIMVHVKRCEAPDCQKLALYHYEGQAAKYCTQHQLPNMLCCQSRRRRCAEPGCQGRAYYKHSREEKDVYCAKHLKDGMVNFQVTCRNENCKAPARFNVPGSKRPEFCIAHRSRDMIRIVHRQKTCDYANCNKQPSYNVRGAKRRRFCDQHKTSGMVNVKRPLCKMEGCTTYATNVRYAGYCCFCFAHLFPDKSTISRFGTKERVVREFLKSAYPDWDWVCDRRVKEGCSGRRPDFLLDLGFQVLIVEVDENQHEWTSYYTESCENRRMMELSQDVGHRPLVIVRFNPDSYVDENGERVPSCWGIDSRTGAVHVVQKHKAAWNTTRDLARMYKLLDADTNDQNTRSCLPVLFGCKHECKHT